MTVHDPLDIGPQMAVHEAAITRLWSIKLAHQRAARRNEDRLDAEIAAHEEALGTLRDARRLQWQADVSLNRRNA